MDNKHQKYMQRALSLAAKGRGKVNPNPCVGCVVVKNGQVLSEGYHKSYGGHHAERAALLPLGRKAKGATLYVTLEPCSYFGKTPPCAPLIIQSGIKEVYIATKDPNPRVRGRGINLLKKAGIRVHSGLEKEAATHLNRPFFKWMKTGIPYVTLKSALTLDGKIATGQGHSKWITSPNSRRMVHKLRVPIRRHFGGKANSGTRQSSFDKS